MEKIRDAELLFFWRGAAQKLDRKDGNEQGMELAFGVDAEVGDELVCHLTCEEVVGTMVTKTLKVR